MRALPVFTFCNKMDRPSLSPFEIIDQLEKEFNLECCPMNWPIGRLLYVLHAMLHATYYMGYVYVSID
jgi:peptide subunit release factor RF-3